MQKYDPDILCLQECTKAEVSRFIQKLPENYFCSHIFSCSCHIFGKFQIEQDAKHTNLKRQGARFVTGKITLSFLQDPIYITNVHLGMFKFRVFDTWLMQSVPKLFSDHRKEPKRLEQLEFIRKNVLNTITDSNYHLMCGDFNALTKEDYSVEEFEQVTLVRSRNSWETPKMDLTKKVRVVNIKVSYKMRMMIVKMIGILGEGVGIHGCVGESRKTPTLKDLSV